VVLVLCLSYAPVGLFSYVLCFFYVPIGMSSYVLVWVMGCLGLLVLAILHGSWVLAWVIGGACAELVICAYCLVLLCGACGACGAVLCSCMGHGWLCLSYVLAWVMGCLGLLVLAILHGSWVLAWVIGGACAELLSLSYAPIALSSYVPIGLSSYVVHVVHAVLCYVLEWVMGGCACPMCLHGSCVCLGLLVLAILHGSWVLAWVIGGACAELVICAYCLVLHGS
jgi:hypothetical protein